VHLHKCTEPALDPALARKEARTGAVAQIACAKRGPQGGPASAGPANRHRHQIAANRQTAQEDRTLVIAHRTVGRCPPFGPTESVMRESRSLCAPHERNCRRLPVLDSLIAATALAQGRTLVTRNTSDYPEEVPLLYPWGG